MEPATIKLWTRLQLNDYADVGNLLHPFLVARKHFGESNLTSMGVRTVILGCICYRYISLIEVHELYYEKDLNLADCKGCVEGLFRVE